MSKLFTILRAGPFRVGYRFILLLLFLCTSFVLSAQQPVITVRFANPQFNCATNEYCLDVEFQSNTANQSLFGMNVRFFYDDSVLEFINFRGFQNGYAAVAPNPPFINTGGAASGPALFNLSGAAEFVNGAVQLTNESAPPIVISTTGWTKLYQVCFSVDNAGANPANFCPSVVWDLISPTSGPGFLAGDDGVVITVVDPSPLFDSAPAIENVVHFNWNDNPASSTMPYGTPSPSICVSTLCSGNLVVTKRDSLQLGPNGVLNVGDIISYKIVVTNNGNVTVSNVALSDPNADAGSLSCPATSLIPGASMTCTATHTITQTDINAGFVTNTVTATGLSGSTTINDLSDDPDDPTNIDPDNDGDPDDPTTTILTLPQPVITTRLSNPQYNCQTGKYCLDVEYKSNTLGQSIFGSNVRFWYDDSKLEFVGFSDFQGGYAAFSPDPPLVSTFGAGTGSAFGFSGMPEFVNGAIQLQNPNAPPIILSTTAWTKIFQICFTVDDLSNLNSFCPAVVWDLEENPADGGFITGSDGVVITVVSTDPNQDSAPAIENVEQFNWAYDGVAGTPYGTPQQTSCISLQCCIVPIATSLNASICQGTSYTFNGQTLTAAGTYTATLTAANGCDSVVTLNLTVKPTKATTLNEAICQGASYSFNGQTLTAAGTYTATLTAANGCDSVVTLNLTVKPTKATTLNEAICQGASYTFNGQTLTAAGAYTATLTAANGCDSVVTLNLTVKPTKATTLNEAICQGDSYAFNGQTLTTAGTYTATLTAANGCDSVVTLNLTVKPTKATTLNEAICQGDSYSFNGQTLTAAGTYTATLTAANGCDSVVTLNLTVKPTKATTLNEAICAGGSYTFNGQTLTAAGTYTATLTAANGCDSVVTLNLTVKPTKATTLNEAICQGASYSFNGQTLTAAGTYTATLTAANGCDSVVTLNLTVKPTKATTLNEAICAGGSYTFNGQTLTAAGTYTATLTAANGCDSVVTLNLTVKPTKATTLNEAICQGASYTFNGQTLTAAGTYTATLTAANGCDSVVTLNLTVKPTKATTLNEAICAGGSYTFNGQTLTAAGTYTATLTAANGCDSVVTLNLSVEPEIRTTLNEAICQGASYSFNGQTLTAAGTYTATLKAKGGCDSIVTLNLTVKPTKATTLNEAICQGASYSFNGQTYTAAGTYTATLTAANGCDSVVTLNLTVKPTKATTLNEAICQGASYAFNGQTLTTTGTYTATLTAANGCDSVVTLNLTVKPTKATTLNEAICQGDSYSFNGQTLTAAGTYTTTLTAANGCDSVVTLNLTVKPTKATTLNEAICQGDSYSFNGQTLTAAGTYTTTLTAANGCDSVVTLNLTVKPTKATTLNEAICQGDSYSFNGQTLTAAGTYTATLTAANGCDSVVTLNLTVKPTKATTLNEAICQGASYTFNGQTLTAAGTYTATLTAANGCDSVVTLNLTVKPTKATTLNESICAGGSYTFNGQTLTTAGTYTATLTAANGCDSVVTLNLTVEPEIRKTLNEAICQGASYTFNGQTLTTAGTYTATFKASGGCDSIVTLNLTVKPTKATTLNEAICQGDSYTFNGQTLTAAGTYTATLTAANGCDSVVTLNLTVKPTKATTLNEAICQGASYSFNGQTLTAAGTYTATLTAANGCDSVVTVNLTVKPIATTTLNEAICAGDSYSFNGQTYTAAGTYTATLTAANGCDSVVTLNLTVKPTKATTLNESICAGGSYTFNGQTLTTAGTYTATLTAANGCDSVVTLNLTVEPEIRKTLNEAICQGASYSFNGQTLTAAGTYTATLTAANGCDSVVTLNLTVKPTKATTLNEAICQGASYTFNGQTLTAAGTYTATLTAANGCDSIVTLNLTVKPTKATTLNESICAGASYSFNGQTLTAAGTYTATLTAANGCDSVVTLNLQVKPTKATTLNEAICAGDSYSFNGQTLIAAGTYTATLTAANGCDSIVTLNLQVAPEIRTTLNEAICAGDSYSFNGQTLTTAGTYTATLTAKGGCDSIVTLNLTVKPIATTTLNESICAGDSYSFNGQTYTAAGTYTATLTAANGCDSVVTLNLQVKPTKVTTLNEAICAGDSYSFNGQTLTAAGTYTVTLTAANGCDSVVTLNLQVKPTKATTLNEAICAGDSYSFNGQTYTAAGTYTATLTAANGCDSIVTLNLQVAPEIRTTLNEAICAGDSYSFNGQTLTTAGTYTATLTAKGGCDSIVTLNLTVKPIATTTLNEAICAGDSYSFNGQTYTAAGTYTATLTAANGCDSVVTLNLTVKPTKSTTLNEAICAGDSYSFNGQTYTAAGTYTATLTAANGCDSVVTLNLTVKPTKSTTLNESICAGASYSFNGQTLTAAGTYTATLTAANGCDSVVTLNLTVKPTKATTLNEAICAGDSYSFNGQTLTAAGTYTATLTAANGCDSVVTLNLQVKPTKATTLNEAICSGGSYTFNGQTLTTAGTYTATLTAANGCDSVVTLNLTVKPTKATTLNEAICAGGSYTFNGQTLTTVGTYTATLTAANGCDSVVTLNLTVEPEIRKTLNEAICQGTSYSFNGQTLTAAGTYTATFKASGGCDSVVTLNLTVKPTKATTLNEAICAGASYSFNGQTLTTAGTYTATLTAANGCDSVVTLNLTVKPTKATTLNEAICQGDSYSFNGQTLTAAGTYTATLTAANGCDSVVTLNLTVKPTKATTLNEAICAGDSYSFNGQTLTAAGTYTATLTAANGCDSVVTLNLQVKPTKATTLNEAICSGGSYTFNGQTLTTAGTYTATLTAANGCDSVVTLNLTVKPTKATTLNEAICAGGSYTFNGQTLTTVGTYTATLTAANGCDSVVTLNLTVEPEIRKTLNEAICQGTSYSFNGQTLTAAGTYTATFKASGGCDSVVTLNLTVKPTKATTLNEAICQGASYTFNGQTLTAAGTYTATLTAANGCDSVVTLNLTVKPTKATTLNESICAGDSYSFNGQTLTAAGTYTATLTAANGCDSVVTLNLTIQPRATVEAGEPKVILASCLGTGSGSVTLTGSSIGGSATSATWTITNQPAGGDGALSGAGPDANPADAIFSASVPGVYTLTLTTNDPAGPCPAVSDQLTITVTNTGNQKVECLACMSQIRVSLDQNCRFLVTPEHVLEGFRDCPNGNLLKDALEVLISDGNNDSYVDCAGTYDYIVRVKKEYEGCIEFTSCWGKIIAEDKTGPRIVCEDWIKEPLECYDVNYVLNNHQTIGKVGATSSPRPSATSNRTIANAEGIADAGACNLKPATLVNDNVKNLGYTFFADACQACGCRTTVKWDDRVVYYNCEQMKTNGGIYARIYRTWVATDCNGMTKDTVQEINFKRPALEDFSFNGTGEGKYDRVVTYNACAPDKSLIKKEDVTPFVCSYFNTTNNPRCLFIDQVECNYSVQIKDTEFPVCGGKGLKIDREMYIFDWCAGGIVDTLHILIKIGDFEAPKLVYAQHAPNALSTGPMDCTAAFPISVAGIKSTFGVAVTDNCGVANVSVRVKTKDRYVKGILVAPNTWEQVEYAVMNGMMTGLPVGRHRLIIDAYDGCYNATRDSFEFDVQDKIAPVMVCDDQLRVSLSNANGYTSGYAQVTAADVDEGSRDNCKLEWIRVRRNVPENCSASFIAKGYDSNGNGKLDPMPADGDWTKADGFDINGDGDLADFGETFILKDGKLLTPLQEMVEFFCCDVAEKVTVELWGEDASGNRNFCWKEVQLEDKVAPTCVAPWDLTIDCDDKNLASIDDRTASSVIWGDVTISSGDDCAALSIEYRTVKSLKCGAGWIDRIWTMTKQTAKGPITITCKQRITIRAIREYNICFPKDAVSDCKTPIVDTVLVDELACDILAVNVTDKRYDASDGECYKIFRTYTVIDWCAYDDRCGDPMTEGSVYVVDRANFENYGKAPIYVLVRDKDRNGTEEFYLSKDLVPNNSGDQAFTPPYCTASGEFYHSFMYTQIIKVYDNERPVVSGVRDTFCTDAAACSANITKVVTIKDNCTDKVELERQLLMIAPFQTLDAGKMILYTTPRWSVKDLGNGQFEIKVSNLPEGTHDLIVVGRDECGNLSTATRIPFVVKDCKAPAPICINGLSTELMPDGTGGGMMAVWAKDFVASAIYDCNGQGPETKDGLKVITKYSINRVGEKVDPAKTSLTLTCADAGKTVLVELHAWDEAGNHDFCVTYIEVQDNRKVCAGSVDAGEISGLITTDELEPVLGVNVDLSGGAQLNQNTGSNGVYLFNNLTKGSDYTVSPQLDKDHINGVSTFDLVFIQKHILGVKAIDNPYRMIAADVNNSKSISTLDMIQIRKLILNIDTKFKSVPSWKFVDATYQFPDPSNPWSAQFPEVANINDLDGKVKADFIAVKMGDVSGNASTTGAVAVETRSEKAMIISTDEQQLQSGQSYTVVFKAKDLAKIQGYQFTLNIDPSLATIEGIDYNGVMKAENFGIFTRSGMITTSYVRAPLAGALPLAGANAPAGQPQGLPLRGDEILFTLKLKAESNTALSRALHLNSRLTNIEAYNQSEEVMGVQLTFGAEAVAERAALRQNVPNPFSEETVVGFYLPKATKAVLTIRDVKGALVYRVEGNYSKGSNQVILKENQLRASGVMYYTLETSDFTETKKMVLLQR